MQARRSTSHNRLLGRRLLGRHRQRLHVSEKNRRRGLLDLSKSASVYEIAVLDQTRPEGIMYLLGDGLRFHIWSWIYPNRPLYYGQRQTLFTIDQLILIREHILGESIRARHHAARTLGNTVVEPQLEKKPIHPCMA